MHILIVVEDPRDWPFRIAGVEVASAEHYLNRTDYAEIRGVRVFNLCRSYQYQRTGYYVSLLAEARGHRPMPSVSVLQDLKSAAVVRVASRDLDALIQRSLADLRSTTFDLSVYFGRNLARRHDRLSLHLFNLFPAPLLRARFVRKTHWRLQSLSAIPAGNVPESHRDFITEAAAAYFAGRRPRLRRKPVPRYDLAILHDPTEPDPPSNKRALDRFRHAALETGLQPTMITHDDYGRLAEFDALFIRETTAVNHPSYRFAQRAAAEGLVVIDDPDSIIRCTNKLFLAEAAERHALPVPPTVIVGRDGLDTVERTVGFPCVLKQPDSAYSRGVVKVDSPQTFSQTCATFRRESDLILAQAFLPTDFDWRVGILDGEPLYVCKYFMAPRHWQIIHHAGTRSFEGRVETVAVDEAPRRVVATALRAARYFGNGLYGVDLKEIDHKIHVIEVNDNPSIDAGFEDTVSGDELYRRVMQVFLKRIAARKNGPVRP